MMLQITANMATTDEVERDLALVTIDIIERASGMPGGPHRIIADSTARAIASWFASPRTDQGVTMLSMGMEAEAHRVMSDIVHIRRRMAPSERYPLDLLMEWVRDKRREEADRVR